MIDVNKIRADFPILSRKVNGQDLVYFDNAATSQTPNQVIEVIVDYYSSRGILVDIDCEGGVNEISDKISAVVDGLKVKI